MLFGLGKPSFASKLKKFTTKKDVLIDHQAFYSKQRLKQYFAPAMAEVLDKYILFMPSIFAKIKLFYIAKAF